MWLGDRGDNEFGLFKYIENEKKFKSYSRDAADTLSLPSNEVLNIMEDDLGRMWVSTDGGVCLFDRASDVFLRSNKEFDIPSVRLREKAGNGKMWLGL